MKKTSVILASIIAAACVTAGFTMANATDTSSDPLVTISYVEEVLEPRLKNELTTYIQENFHSQSNNVTDENGENIVINTGYSIVNLKKGQILYPISSTEIVLRSGTADVVSSYMDQGINDMTEGIELYNGDALPRYHYCLIPRGDDGRTIVATSDEIYIMVRGEFEIRE